MPEDQPEDQPEDEYEQHEQHRQQAATAVARAEALAAAGRPEQAAGLLERHLAGRPDDAGAWAALARSLVNLPRPRQDDGTRERAVHAARQLVRLRPADADGHYVLAAALVARGRPAEAEPAVRDALRLAPGSASVHVMASEVELRLAPGGGRQRLDAALAAALEAVRLAPHDPATHRQASRAFTALGRIRDAAAAMEHVLRLAPEDARARSTLVRLQSMLGRARLTDTLSADAEALAADPVNDEVSAHNLNVGLHRLLRRARWLALLCLVVAAAAARVFPAGSEPDQTVPAPLADRVTGLAAVAALCGLSLLLTWRRVPAGAWRDLRALCRRVWVVRMAALTAGWVLLCALALLLVPFSSRGPLQAITHAGWVPVLVTAYVDRSYRRLREPLRWYRG